jgi:heme/copper-type cytochrome/quinol oxidase subunit 1
MVMIIYVILITIGIITSVITGIMIDKEPNPKPLLFLSFWLSVIIGLSALISFIVGHFTGA